MLLGAATASGRCYNRTCLANVSYTSLDLHMQSARGTRTTSNSCMSSARFTVAAPVLPTH